MEWKGGKTWTIHALVVKVCDQHMRMGRHSTSICQTAWSLEDTTKNVCYFLSVVKKATGNTCDLEVEAQGKVILSSNQGPGICITDF